MSDRTKLSSLLLICVLAVFGCKGTQTGPMGRGELVPAEKKKAELLAKLERRFDNPQAHFELGRLYQADGLWRRAEYRYNTTLSLDPVHKQAQAAMVKLLTQTGQGPKAQIHADIYINQAGTSEQSCVALAEAFREQGLNQYALRCYRQALTLSPDSPATHKRLGYYFLRVGDKARAREHLKRSFELDPYQAEVAGELGRLGVIVRISRKNAPQPKNP